MLVQVGRKRLGLALGAGGLRGAAHIGVLRSLEKHGVEIHALSGSSAGAVVATFHAAGFSPAQMEQLVLSLNAAQLYDPDLNLKSLLGAGINALLSVLRIPSRYHLPFPQGLIRGDAWERWLLRHLGRLTVADLALPVALLAVDIDSGQPVVFSQVEQLDAVTMDDQLLALALRASSAIPGVFRPATVAGRSLVDGGIRASVPAGLLRGMGADVIVAVDLATGLQRDNPVDNIYEIIGQSLDILEEELTRYQLAGAADMIVRPVEQNVGLLDFDQVAQLINLGELAMDEAMPALRALLAAK